MIVAISEEMKRFITYNIVLVYCMMIFIFISFLCTSAERGLEGNVINHQGKSQKKVLNIKLIKEECFLFGFEMLKSSFFIMSVIFCI